VPSGAAVTLGGSVPAKRKRITKKKGKPAGNGVMALIKELWQAAVGLRDSIEPADYKRYVLPLIFLRFLSLRYQRRRADLERRVSEPGDELYTKNPKIIRAILNDDDEYRSVGAFRVPEKASWEYIRTRARADNIKVILDEALELLEKAYPKQLKGLLPPIYAGSNLDNESVAGLINLFSKGVFEQDHNREDLIGRVYEYFIGEFANSEGKRGGEYFTPVSIVRTLVAMLEPKEGIVFDPCCGSGGMFVQSDVFTQHSRQLAFYGQESKDFTYRLCRMNLFIHGLDGNVHLGNSYFDDKHSTLKADFVLANPPFNDGSKADNGWGADRISDKDPRVMVDGERVPLSPRNGNTMWILHFLAHLREGGAAGFVMATGELSNSEIARQAVRRALVEHNFIDCIVQLTPQLFANTQIGCSLWFLSKARAGGGGSRKRTGEILFIDGRRLGSLIPGSRKQKQLSDEEVGRIGSVYRQYRCQAPPDAVTGFCRVATFDEVREHNYVLTPGRYVGAEDVVNDDEPFDVRFPLLTGTLQEQVARGRELDAEIMTSLGDVLNGR
jgi:type I restriction enzyme M protein